MGMLAPNFELRESIEERKTANFKLAEATQQAAAVGARSRKTGFWQGFWRAGWTRNHQTQLFPCDAAGSHAPRGNASKSAQVMTRWVEEVAEPSRFPWCAASLAVRVVVMVALSGAAPTIPPEQQSEPC
mmetsp:Transcript_9065/g.17734  ORF Transcript_9065/g.17734 Transcript_9065/m.17734 type:complete len:129 (+) Transcript_9065:86-472(+)